MTGSTSGHVTITATYSGDSHNKGSSGKALLTIAKAPTTTTVSCTSSSFGISTSTTCTATVSGGYPAQTGTVAWSEVSGTGKVTFSPTTCTLASGSCSVNVSGAAAGSAMIKAVYGGDSNNLKSAGKLSLKVT